MKYIIAVLMASATFVSAAENYLAYVSVAPVGVVNIDPSNGGKEWGAGIKMQYDLNPTVSFNLGLIAYDDWKGSAIDESPLEVRAVLFSSQNKGASLYAIGGVDRSWRYDDWGMKGGLGLSFQLRKNVSIFTEATYDVWNHGSDRLQVPFGIRIGF